MDYFSIDLKPYILRSKVKVTNMVTRHFADTFAHRSYLGIDFISILLMVG
jgi:uncharacterized Rmd1/YagE family protein